MKQEKDNESRIRMRTVLRVATWVVCLHVLVVLSHSVAHFAVHVLPATFFDNAFVVVVILIAPVAALLLLYTAHLARLGTLLLLLSMAGALLYGLLNHFVFPGADNALQMPTGGWHVPFLVTSYLLALLEAAGIVVGLWAGAVLIARRKELRQLRKASDV